MSQSSRSSAARAAALERVGRVGGASVSAPARSAFLQKFIDQTDPSLPSDERERRARALLRAHMTRLAIKSANSRRATDAAAELRTIAAEAASLAAEIESE